MKKVIWSGLHGECGDLKAGATGLLRKDDFQYSGCADSNRRKTVSRQQTMTAMPDELLSRNAKRFLIAFMPPALPLVVMAAVLYFENLRQSGWGIFLAIVCGLMGAVFVLGAFLLSVFENDIGIIWGLAGTGILVLAAGIFPADYIDRDIFQCKKELMPVAMKMQDMSKEALTEKLDLCVRARRAGDETFHEKQVLRAVDSAVAELRKRYAEESLR